jgi:hypothetical protein
MLLAARRYKRMSRDIPDSDEYGFFQCVDSIIYVGTESKSSAVGGRMERCCGVLLEMCSWYLHT